MFGNRLLTGRIKYLTVGVLVGIVTGLSAGVVGTDLAFEHAAIEAGLDRSDPFFGKMTGGVQGAFRSFGLLCGPLAGAAVGATTATAWPEPRRGLRTTIVSLAVIVVCCSIIWSVSIRKLSDRMPDSPKLATGA
jgi:hypothetical protein